MSCGIISLGMGELHDQDFGWWMNGLVEQLGCNAILVLVNFYAKTGKKEEEGSVCQECHGGTGGGYMGCV